jgi:glycosyltransferase involved in cell wall biosynthesis
MSVVTVAIPFAGDDLRSFVSAVRSVYAQSLADWSLLLVDDGADHALVSAAKRIEDERVCVVSDGRRVGLAGRLNQVAGLARTPYLARMDADDVMHPDRLATQLATMERDGSLDVVGSRAVVIDEQNQVAGLLREGETVPAHAAGFLTSNAFTHPSVLGRTAWFVENPYDATIGRAEDKDLWLRTHGHSHFYKDPAALLYYRVGRRYSRRKNVLTARDDRRVVLGSSARAVGTQTRARAAARATAKELMYRAMPAGAWARIRDQRIVPLDAGGIVMHQQTVDRTLAVGVPGW